MTGTIPSFGSFSPTPTGADPAFPGSGTSASDDSLSGVSQALGVVPVAVSGKRLSGFMSVFAPGTLPLPQSMSFDIQPINTAILNLDKMPKAQKATVQNALYLAGYLANPPLVPGEVDTATRAAYRTAVEDAARQSKYDNKNQLTEPVTVAQVIQDRIANRQAQGVAAGSTVQKPQVALTSPDEIRAAVVAAAKSEYGHKADDGLINSIIDRYQKLQTQAQESTAPTVTNPPAVSTFASQQLQGANPTEVAANRGLSVGNLFMQAFQSSAGQQPTPVGG